jgi:diaminohydroxyphosphoribosylaminopyrimidine deaminase/5-amino-6-(5-phosphoribosylamino)uracil reductase
MAIFPGLKDLKESIVPQPAPHIELPDHYDHHPGDDHKFMAKALKLAEKGRNTTHPNPRVGCVITRNGVLVGKGYHEFAGEPHAEINALKDAGRYASGGTLYVNLEPCCHHGRTPPCTDSIIKAGISRVVIAMEDPNPLVNRAGISALQKAGIVVETGINHERAIWLNRGFVRRITQGTPWVTLKIAISLDGKTAMESGESQWITSDAARQDAHRVRAESSAILTGIGTVLRDNPKMTARIEKARRQPLRIILDSRLSTPADAAILEPPGKVLIITAPSEAADAEIFRQSNVEVISCQMKGASIDLQQVMLELGRREINNLMLEAGSRLSGAMLQQGLVDELVVYMAPDLLGSNARGMFRIPGLESIEDKYRLEFQDVRQIGRDLKLTLTLSDKRPRVV